MHLDNRRIWKNLRFKARSKKLYDCGEFDDISEEKEDKGNYETGEMQIKRENGAISFT
jgi:hypothetical protein